MLLGDLDYLTPDYELAKNEYDSVEMSSLVSQEDQDRLTTRLNALQTIVANIEVVRTEDSLQAVAALPKSDRENLIRKKLKQLRKVQGLSEEDNSTFVNPAVQMQNPAGGGTDAAGNDLVNAQAAAKGDWYFNNNTLKSTGFTTFKSAWGNRPDVDNWRRIDAVTKQMASINHGNPDDDDDSNTVSSPMDMQPGKITAGTPQKNDLMNGEITYDALLENLPLTEDKLKISNNSIAEAFFNNGVQFQNVLEDYNAAIASYDSLLNRFPQTEHLEEALFNLHYCYNKIGKKFSADSVLTVLNTKFKDGKFATLLAKHPVSNQSETEDAATKEYERIYNLFIEGKFDEAKNAKTKADSIYGNSYWTSQLLYIESIYYVTKHEDSAAIETLTSLKDQFSNSPLADKAETMINVLNRRSEIEEYLTNLQVKRYDEDEPSHVVVLSHAEKVMEKQEIKNDTIKAKPAQIAKANVDSFKTVNGTVVRTYIFNASDSQFVGVVLDKVDPVYQNEARNAFNRYNKVNFYSQNLSIASSKINDSLNVVLIGPFADAATAMVYLDKVKPKTAGTIIPWLKPEKYSFTIISKLNLDILDDTKDLNGYKNLLQQVLPGKF